MIREDIVIRDWLRVEYLSGTRYVKASDLVDFTQTSSRLDEYSPHKAGFALGRAESRGWLEHWGRGHTNTYRIRGDALTDESDDAAE